jgi:hypothetical protein
VKKQDRKKVRHWAEFASSLPTDLIEDDHDIIQNGGRSVAAAIGEILTGLGCDVEPPRYAGDHGWDFCGQIRDAEFFCQVTLIEDYIFLFQRRSEFPSWFQRHPPALYETLRALAAAMAKDERFSNVRWVYEPLGDETGVVDPLIDV